MSSGASHDCGSIGGGSLARRAATAPEGRATTGAAPPATTRALSSPTEIRRMQPIPASAPSRRSGTTICVVRPPPLKPRGPSGRWGEVENPPAPEERARLGPLNPLSIAVVVVLLAAGGAFGWRMKSDRSEEHTSEL